MITELRYMRLPSGPCLWARQTIEIKLDATKFASFGRIAFSENPPHGGRTEARRNSPLTCQYFVIKQKGPL